MNTRYEKARGIYSVMLVGGMLDVMVELKDKLVYGEVEMIRCVIHRASSTSASNYVYYLNGVFAGEDEWIGENVLWEQLRARSETKYEEVNEIFVRGDAIGRGGSMWSNGQVMVDQSKPIITDWLTK